jgi:hypothetical protein
VEVSIEKTKKIAAPVDGVAPYFWEMRVGAVWG